MVNVLYVIALTASLAVLASADEPIASEAAAASFFPQVDYCHLRSCNGRVHTLCKYPFLQPARQCGRVISSVLTPYEMQELRDVHKTNRFSLTWDWELATMAQTWANQCITRNDDCRNTQSYIVAQSFAWRKTTGPCTARLSEMVDLNAVPQRATLVGCGAIRYNPDGLFNWTYLVCNYANGGY